MPQPHTRARRPSLRKRFFVRRHRGWGAAVCWYSWNPLLHRWGINWGIACKTMREAKQLRKFLNGRVALFPGDCGVPFDDAVRFVSGGVAGFYGLTLTVKGKDDGILPKLSPRPVPLQV